MEKIKTLSDELNKLADEATEAFQAVEDMLRDKLNFDVMVREGHVCLCYYSTYTEDRRPGIFIRPSDSDPWLPFRNHQRDCRIDGAAVLPALLNEVARLLEVKTEHSRTSVAGIRMRLGELRRK